MTVEVMRCWYCTETKPASEFYIPRSRPNGKGGACKVCSSKRAKARVERRRELYRQNPGKYRDIPNEARRLREGLKRYYGMTVADFERLVAEQGGKCAICGEPPTGRRLCVDHCHDSGVVRGLLCKSCNQAIGFFRDLPDRARSAAAYLDKHAHLKPAKPTTNS